MIRKIVLCTDGSDGALKAAQFTADLAASLKAEVALVSVYCPPVGALLWTTQPQPTSLADVLSTGETVEQALTARASAILAEGHVSFRTFAEVGDPVQVILDIAEREHADMIVVGSRGLGGFSSLLLGSVSDNLAHHASCPVLIVR